ncbi:acyl-CoA dehydrogenase family protein [Georgenia muralis]|uniref:Alkylation response protein AidB-like acyl-CoA dehydrogenase n=1 Tax=Georgenia muralis TaxID=154117 RepID=A0A3N4Z146_9MICO|nr:acyl-CoA dehydrogenase family protein [Georgenia muralis]RPF26273.1 alkylation response protein AidB-like acyl-CoA dehydrogenase [Georgenia muralis]
MPLLDQLDTFVTDVLAPRAAEIDETAEFPQDVISAAAQIGLQRVLIGDDGTLDPSRAPLVHEISERLAMHSMASAVAIANAHLTTYLLLKYAPAELTERWVEPTLTGETFGAFAITEAHAGTDVRGMASVARRDGDDYLLTGEKAWVGYAPNASFAIVLAKEGTAERDAPMVALVVDTASPGVTGAPGPAFSGLRGMSNGTLSFDDVRVPAWSRLSVEGFGGMMDGLNLARIDAASYACGLLRGALVASTERAARRTAFGRPLGDLQAIQAKIGRMATDYQAARALTARAAASFAAGDGGDQDVISMAKLFTSEAARRHTDAAVQIHGAEGMVRSSWVNRLDRDAKVTQIFDGTSEIHETMLGRRAVRLTAAGGDLGAFLGREQ